MERTDYDRLTALADQRAAAADAAADELRRVGDEFTAIAAGAVAFKRVADQLTAMGQADRKLAAVFRRAALAERAPAPEPPAPPPHPDDWRAWTEDTFPEPEPDPAAAAPGGQPSGVDVPDDWGDSPLTADIRLGEAPTTSPE
jgi:hypothetical protein